MKRILSLLCGLGLLLHTIPALAAGIEGEYKYAGKGLSGSFIVKKQGDKYHFSIDTVTDDPSAHLCGYEGEATLDGPVLRVPMMDIDDKPMALLITFKNGAAELDDPDNKGRQVWCGMRGWMSGTYKKKK